MPQSQSFRYDVFLSHSSNDKDFVRHLDEKLRAVGVRTFFDERDIPWGGSIPKSVEDALDQSQHLILVLSPDALNSDWVNLERCVRVFQSPAGGGRSILPLVRRECAELPPLVRTLRYLRVRNDREFQQVWPQIITHLRKKPAKRSTRLGTAEATETTSSKSNTVTTLPHQLLDLRSAQGKPVRVIPLSFDVPDGRSIYDFDRRRLRRCRPDELVRFIGVTGKTVLLPELNSDEDFFSPSVERRYPLPLAIRRGVRAEVLVLDPESPAALFRSAIESGPETQPARRLLQRDALSVERNLVPTYVHELRLSTQYIREHLDIRRTSVGIAFSAWLFDDVALVEPLHFGKQEGRPHLCTFARFMIPRGNEEYGILEKHFDVIWNSNRTKKLKL